jgi:hypothetical protein
MAAVSSSTNASQSSDDDKSHANNLKWNWYSEKRLKSQVNQQCPDYLLTDESCRYLLQLLETICRRIVGLYHITKSTSLDAAIGQLMPLPMHYGISTSVQYWRRTHLRHEKCIPRHKAAEFDMVNTSDLPAICTYVAVLFLNGVVHSSHFESRYQCASEKCVVITPTRIDEIIRHDSNLYQIFKDEIPDA